MKSNAESKIYLFTRGHVNSPDYVEIKAGGKVGWTQNIDKATRLTGDDMEKNTGFDKVEAWVVMSPEAESMHRRRSVEAQDAILDCLMIQVRRGGRGCLPPPPQMA